MLPQRLKALREKHGLLQNQVADKMGVTRGTVGHWEAGTRTPDLTQTTGLAKLYNTSVSYLVGETDIPDVPPKNPGEPDLRALRSQLLAFGATEDDIKAITEYLQAGLRLRKRIG